MKALRRAWPLLMAHMAVAWPASAQVPVPIEPLPAPAPPSPPAGAVGKGAEEAAGEAAEGLYLSSEEDAEREDGVAPWGEGEPGERHEGPVPDLHVVRPGDTLWDLCSYYFGDSWRWPRVWALNPNITNPHWIFPGDVIRLAPGRGEATGPTTLPGAARDAIARDLEEPAGPLPIELRQLSFVSTDDLKVAATVIGSTEDKVMLTVREEIYLNYPPGRPPQVGRRHAIYSPTEDIIHPVTKEKIGAVVKVVGEVQVTDVKKGKMARGIITYVTDTVERGFRVGAIKTQFKDITPAPGDKDLEGLMIDVIGGKQLIGARSMVFLDRGSDDGLKVGNRLQIVRRGDAFTEFGASPIGRDDRRFPDEVLGEIIVVEPGPKVSLCYVEYTTGAVFVGDRVVMYRGAK